MGREEDGSRKTGKTEEGRGKTEGSPPGPSAARRRPPRAATQGHSDTATQRHSDAAARATSHNNVYPPPGKRAARPAKGHPQPRRMQKDAGKTARPNPRRPPRKLPDSRTRRTRCPIPRISGPAGHVARLAVGNSGQDGRTADDELSPSLRVVFAPPPLPFPEAWICARTILKEFYCCKERWDRTLERAGPSGRF